MIITLLQTDIKTGIFAILGLLFLLAVIYFMARKKILELLLGIFSLVFLGLVFGLKILLSIIAIGVIVGIIVRISSFFIFKNKLSKTEEYNSYITAIENFDFENAFKFLDNLVQKDSNNMNNPDILVPLSLISSYLKKEERFLEILEQNKLKINNITYQYYRAVCLSASDEFEEVNNLLMLLSKSLIQKDLINTIQVKLKIKQKNYDEALHILENFDTGSYYYLNTKAKIYKLQGNKEEAIKTLKQALSVMENDKICNNYSDRIKLVEKNLAIEYLVKCIQE